MCDYEAMILERQEHYDWGDECEICRYSHDCRGQCEHEEEHFNPYLPYHKAVK